MGSQLLDWQEGNGEKERMISEGSPVHPDMVNNPPHYNKHGIEVIDILEMYFADKPLLFNAGKYLLRCLYKGHKEEDLRKCIWYCEREIANDKNALSDVPREQGDS